MSKSYSAARYKDGFFVSQQDAGELYKLTLSFFKLAKTMCEEKIGLLESQANQNQDSEHADQSLSEAVIINKGLIISQSDN